MNFTPSAQIGSPLAIGTEIARLTYKQADILQYVLYGSGVIDNEPAEALDPCHHKDMEDYFSESLHGFLSGDPFYKRPMWWGVSAPAIYSTCLALERRGLLKRATDDYGRLRGWLLTPVGDMCCGMLGLG